MEVHICGGPQAPRCLALAEGPTSGLTCVFRVQGADVTAARSHVPLPAVVGSECTPYLHLNLLGLEILKQQLDASSPVI